MKIPTPSVTIRGGCLRAPFVTQSVYKNAIFGRMRSWKDRRGFTRLESISIFDFDTQDAYRFQRVDSHLRTVILRIEIVSNRGYRVVWFKREGRIFGMQPLLLRHGESTCGYGTFVSSPELVERFSSGLGLWVVCACKVGRQTLFLRYNYGVKLVRAQDGSATCSSYRDL